jgi:hypothetical protein
MMCFASRIINQCRDMSLIPLELEFQSTSKIGSHRSCAIMSTCLSDITAFCLRFYKLSDSRVIILKYISNCLHYEV